MTRALAFATVLVASTFTGCAANEPRPIEPRPADVDRAIADYDASRKNAQGERESERSCFRDDLPSSRAACHSPSPSSAPKTIAAPRFEPRRVRSRRRIDVDLVNADLTNTMRLLADAAGVNVVVEGGMVVPVSARLRAVDPIAAMEAIARANGLDLDESGAVLVVRKR